MMEQQRYNELYKSLSVDGSLIHVSKLLERAARLWPKNKMVICLDEQVTYKELYYRACLLAQELRELGVKKGERVLIFYENSIEFYIAYFAVWQAGGVVAPLNVFLHEDELIRIIEDANPIVIIISDHLKERLGKYPREKLPTLVSEIDKTSKLPKSVPEIVLEKTDVHEVAAFFTHQVRPDFLKRLC